eukprot:m51a1_g4690 hypothetical protein (256) ;mRNA; f:192876-194502
MSQTGRLDRLQREKVRNFISFTNTSEAVAVRALRECRWEEEVAVNEFFNNPTKFGAVEADPRAVGELFARYRNAESGMVDCDERLARDLGLPDANDVGMLVLAWRLHSRTVGQFSSQEWSEGLAALRVDTIEGLREKIAAEKAALANDSGLMREFYTFVFDYAREERKKVIDCSVAIELWRSVLGGRFHHLDLWVEFLEAENHLKPINRDVWVLLLDFATTIRDDFSNYDEAGAWPVLLDQFVGYAKGRVMQVDH